MKKVFIALMLAVMLAFTGCGADSGNVTYSSGAVSFTASPGTVITEDDGGISISKDGLTVKLTVTDAAGYASEDAADWDRERLDLRSGAFAGTFGNSYFIYEFFKYLVPGDAFCGPPHETAVGPDGITAYASSFSGDGFCGEITETVKNGYLVTVYVLVSGPDTEPYRGDIDLILDTIEI